MIRLIFAFLFTLQIFQAAVSAQIIQEVESAQLRQKQTEFLALKSPLERTMSGGETHDFLIKAKAGDAVLITVEQRDIDVAVSVFDATETNNKINEADFSYGVFGTEELFFIADESGDYRVRVNFPDKTAKPGSYRIEFIEQRAASDTDRQEFLAQKIFLIGEQARIKSTTASNKEAVAKFDEAAAIWKKIGSDKGVALANYYKIIIYFNSGNLEPGLAAARTAIPLWRKVGNRYMEAVTLNHAGVLANALGERQQALDFYVQALPIWRALKNLEGEGAILNNMGGVYHFYGDLRRALEFYEQAMPLRRAGTEKNGIASTLNNIGSCYQGLGNPDKAAPFYLESLAISKELNDYMNAAITLGNLSDLARNAGDTDRAFEYLREAIELLRKTGNRFEEAARLAQLIELYRYVGDYVRAKDVQQQTFNLSIETKNRDAQLGSLQSLGRIYYETGDYEKSRESFRQALELAKTLNKEHVVGYLLDNIGMTLLSANRPDEALNYAAQAGDLWRKTGYLTGSAENFYNLGLVYRQKGNLTAAVENFRQSLAIAEQTQIVRIQAWAHYEIARAKIGLNDLPAALESIEKAVRLAETSRSNISRDDFRVSSFAQNQRFYELNIEILLQLGEQTKKTEYVARALEASENARARSFVELLNRSGAGIKDGADENLLRQQREINNTLNAKAERQTRLLSDGKASADELKIIAGEISALTEEREKLAAQIRRASPNYAALTQPAPLKSRDIQALLDKDTVLLEFSLGDARSSLWLVTDDSISLSKLPKREEIENAARSFYESLKNNNGAADISAGKALSEMLLKPVAKQLAGKRIIFVGEGALQYISFAALPSPNEKDRFLIETNEILNLPSASTLAVLRRSKQNRKTAAKTIAVFADPVFSSQDPRVKNKQTSQAENPASEKLRRSFEESGESGEEILKSIPRLPFSRREAEAILQGVPAADALKFIDFAASANAATGENLADYKIIHFATHGLLNSKNPELSGLVLSLVNEKGEAQNGFLRLNDIYNLRLNSELVVLSACQTALGKDIKGEGLIGLTRGFMYAGSPRVVASLWKVDDAGSAELMRHFYGNMFGKKMRPAEALRAAQIDMLRDERFKSPYFWAAFTLQGEWK